MTGPVQVTVRPPFDLTKHLMAVARLLVAGALFYALVVLDERADANDAISECRSTITGALAVRQADFLIATGDRVTREEGDAETDTDAEAREFERAQAAFKVARDVREDFEDRPTGDCQPFLDRLGAEP